MELNLIEDIKKRVQGHERDPSATKKGIGDDCALISPSTDKDVLITTDTLVEGTHFRLRYFPPRFLAKKLTSVNVSDIAAMGGVPSWALLNLEIPPYLRKSRSRFWNEFELGLREALSRYGITLVGGDTVSVKRGGLGLTMTLLGTIERGRAVFRSGAKEGDLIYVSGFLGESEAGRTLLEKTPPKGLSRPIKKYLISRHLDPSPRPLLGRILSGIGVNAMIDISDGIATDLAHIAKESGLKARIFYELIPISRPLVLFSKKKKDRAVQMALFGGEDFELLWTVSPSNSKKVEREVAKALGMRPFLIGRMERGKGVILERQGHEMDITFRGYEH